jgi:hypothetical protein
MDALSVVPMAYIYVAWKLLWELAKHGRVTEHTAMVVVLPLLILLFGYCPTSRAAGDEHGFIGIVDMQSSLKPHAAASPGHRAGTSGPAATSSMRDINDTFCFANIIVTVSVRRLLCVLTMFDAQCQ